MMSVKIQDHSSQNTIIYLNDCPTVIGMQKSKWQVKSVNVQLLTDKIFLRVNLSNTLEVPQSYSNFSPVHVLSDLNLNISH